LFSLRRAGFGGDTTAALHSPEEVIEGMELALHGHASWKDEKQWT